ncbi:MAG: phosphatase PAP2 family protein [Bacteroidota bacterium]|nr:phosphatase PAP2 family protein [Bacteroidota bacterium]
MNALLSLDQSVFLAINGWNSPFWDPIMYFISGKLSWLPFYIFLIYLIFRNYGKKGWLILLLVAVTILLSDTGSVLLFKNTVQRLRPSHEPALEGMVHFVNGYKGGQFGFVSSHASNFSALVTFLIIFLGTRYKWLAPTLIFWAVLICYSRIYLGVHYPLDILCGAIYGVLAGYLVAEIGKRKLKIEFRE